MHPDMRQRAKPLQLGINYGMGVPSLAKGLDRHPLIASGIIERHKRRYPRFWQWRTERVQAAAEVAHAGSAHLVLTARAENHFHGYHDLDDTIARLKAYQDAGADVLYAPGLRGIEQIRTVLEAIDRPLNVLTWAHTPSVKELADAGVSRVSVGSALAFAAYGTLLQAARELRDEGTYSYLEGARLGYVEGARTAFART